MRNISKELQERLSEIEIQREALQKELNSLMAQEDSLKVLLQAEAKRWQSPTMFPGLATTTVSVKTKGRTPLSKFILNSLSAENKTLKALIVEGQQVNILSEKKYPGRSLQFALVALKNAGLVDKVDGVWALKRKEAVNVAGLDDLRESPRLTTQPV